MSKSLLLKEYKDFYCTHYGIDSNHERAVTTIQYIQTFFTDKGAKILEYGCATGFNLRYLNLEGYTNLWGLDGYGPFIEEGEKVSPNIMLKNHNLANGALERDSWADFDFIFTRGVLQQGLTRKEKIKNNDSEVEKILLRLRCMLKDTGSIILAEGPVRDWRGLANSVGLNKQYNVENGCLLIKV